MIKNYNLILLRETYDSWDFKESVKPERVNLQEKLIEAFDSKYPILSVYKIPIWKLNQKNRNGRIYPLALAQKIVKDNKVTVSLDSHPEDDYVPKIKDIIAIGKNPYIENDILWVYCYIVDEEIDKKMSRALDLGYAFEQSSSGFGEVLEDTVNAENYYLERYFDLLINESSYEVYLTKESEVKIAEKNDTNYYSENKKLIENNNEEIIMSAEKDKATLLLEKNFESGVTKRFKEAKSIESLPERKKELVSILSLFEDFDKDSFATLKTHLAEALKETEKEVESIVEKAKTLGKEKVESDKNLVEASEKIKVISKQLEEANSKLEVAYKVMDESKEDYTTLKTLYENLKAEANSKIDAEDYSNLNEEYENLKKDFTTLLQKVKEQEEKPDEDTSAEKKDKEEKDKKEKEGQEKVSESDECEKKGEEEMTDEDFLNEEIEVDADKEIKDDEKITEEDEETAIVDPEESKEDELTEQAEEETEKEPEESEEDKELEEEEESEEEEEIEKVADEEKKVTEKTKEPSLKHPSLSIENRNKMKEYYVSIRRKYGKKVVPFRERILTCSTLAEAQILFIKKVQPVLFEDTFAPEKRYKGKEASTEKIYKESLEKKGIRTMSNIAKLAAMRGGV